MIRSYTDLSRFDTLEERFRYLSLGGQVGEATFGFDRWINQEFYRSREWKRARDHAIARDEGCDLGVPGYEIHTRLLVHHMNPMQSGDIIRRLEDILNPEFLITTTHQTHNAIHYGDESLLPKVFVERRPGDTNLWGTKGRR